MSTGRWSWGPAAAAVLVAALAVTQPGASAAEPGSPGAEPTSHEHSHEHDTPASPTPPAGGSGHDHGTTGDGDGSGGHEAPPPDDVPTSTRVLVLGGFGLLNASVLGTALLLRRRDRSARANRPTRGRR